MRLLLQALREAPACCIPETPAQMLQASLYCPSSCHPIPVPCPDGLPAVRTTAHSTHLSPDRGTVHYAWVSWGVQQLTSSSCGTHPPCPVLSSHLLLHECDPTKLCHSPRAAQSRSECLGQAQGTCWGWSEGETPLIRASSESQYVTGKSPTAE